MTYRDTALRPVPALCAVLVILLAVVRRRALLDARSIVPRSEVAARKVQREVKVIRVKCDVPETESRPAPQWFLACFAKQADLVDVAAVKRR